MDPILATPVAVGDGGVVLEEAPAGLPIIALPTALTGLHYFDGLAMRDTVLTVEQRYRRALAALAARAGGSGVVAGLDVDQRGDDSLLIGAGQAVDGAGRLLDLPRPQSVAMADLIAASRTLMPEMDESVHTSPELLRCIRHWTRRPPAARSAPALWLISASWAESAGNARGGDRSASVVREGIRLRATPLSLSAPLLSSHKVALDPRLHLRSLVASALFAGEWTSAGGFISRPGLRGGVWCAGAQWEGDVGVPLAVVARVDEQILFTDSWMVRRERHETAPARYWAGVMRMRPRAAYLAQVLQFQCQLADAGVAPGALPPAACADLEPALTGAATYLGTVYQLARAARALSGEERSPGERAEYDAFAGAGGMTRLAEVANTMAERARRARHVPRSRQLIHFGIVELPPAGYLPVAVDDKRTVNEQARALLGDGVELNVCVVAPDVAAYELEQGQHMERISLLAGIDDPARRPHVDILVPGGVAIAPPPPAGRYEADLRWPSSSFGNMRLHGAARRERLPAGGAAWHLAAASDSALWITVRANRSLHDLAVMERASIAGRAVLLIPDAVTADVIERSGDSPATVARDDVMDASGNGTRDEDTPGARAASGAAGWELTFDGELTMRSISLADDGARQANATVLGTVALIRRRADGDEDVARVQGRRLSLLVRMTWESRRELLEVFVNDGRGRLSDRAEPLLAIETARTSDDARIRVTLSAASLLGRLFENASDESENGENDDGASLYAVASSRVIDQSNRTIVLDLIENPDVARRTQPLHQQAVAAIRDVQTLLADETTFARHALRALFPRAPHPDLLVRATRDWMLFRRRRHQRFIPWQPPADGGLVRYRLLAITLSAADDTRRLLLALRAPGATLAGLLEDANISSRKEAGGAIADPRSVAPAWVSLPRDGTPPPIDPAELRAALAAFGAGPSIAGAVITSDGADGPGVLLRRLQSLTPLFAPDAVVQPDAPFFALGTTPPDVASPDADGIILLITT